MRQALKGAASSCLDGFSPLVEHYESALEHVKARFGQPRKVVRHVVKAIVDMAKLASNSAKDVCLHYDSIQGKLFTLKKYADKLENPLEAIILPILESKLTPELRQDWEKELVEGFEDDKFASFDRFSEWYLKQVRSREVIGEPAPKKELGEAKGSGKKGDKPFTGQALATKVGGPDTAPPSACAFCEEKHFTRKCRKLGAESLEKC